MMVELSDKPVLGYHPTSFSQGRMEFAWEELGEEEVRRAYADWQAGKGLIGGNPHHRPGAERLPDWGVDRPFFRALALEDATSNNGERLRGRLAGPQPVEVEIGFGRGDFLLDRAARLPQTTFLGYEIRTKATRLMLGRVERLGLDNLWISDDDCRFNLPRLLPDGRLDALHVLFPDPWWKPQHKVKRLFSPPFVDLVAAKLRPGGLLYVKSDVQEYGAWVCYLVARHGGFRPPDPELAARLGPYAPTHREQWCLRHGLPVFTFAFERL